MSQVAVYVDGFNLYHAMDVAGRHDVKWLDLNKVATLFLNPGDTLVKVAYFTAVLTWNLEKQMRHKNYIAALEHHGVQVIQSVFHQPRKYCKTFARYCKFDEEKQTDVAIACAMLRDAIEDRAQRLILISADSDQVPLFKTIREMRPETEIEIAAPPDRLKQARSLGMLATWYREISFGQLASCQFPRNVYNGRGVLIAARPAGYV